MKILKEIIWIVIALIVAAIVQLKIVEIIDYKFIIANTLVIFMSIYYLSVIADFKNVFYMRNKWFKYFMFAFNLFMFVFIITRIQKFVVIYDTFSITAYTNNFILLSTTEESSLIEYIHKEFLLFSIFSLVAIVFFNIKTITSFWKK